MPGISRFKQVAAEAKFNVTTEFTNLGLHSAAASGDYGLVRYALANGQPINSVLHGVLPIHVACSGGDEQVVNLLIDNGADVNAPRLPLRYTSDKNRDTSAPIVGTSGSTPLHFACANGHVNIVTILLQHGAHPDRADKHGVTPESLARESGHENCAETIHRWIEQKDQDLKNRAEYLHDGPSSSTTDSLSRKHLHVKRSIDNALSLFRTNSSTPLAPPPAHSTTTSPSNSPVNEYALGLNPNTIGDVKYQKTRRPSLPVPKPSTGTSSRRPRSAGTGAEGPTQQQRNLGAGRTSSKYSLRNLLRKQSQVSLVDSDSPSRPSLSISPNSSDKHTRNASIDSPVGEPTPSRFKSRFGSDAADRPLMAAEIHNQLVLEDLYDESLLDGSPSNSPAPTGILRGHSRSSSISQRHASRALRFDSNSSAPGLFARRTSSPRRMLTLNGSNSISSLRGIDPTVRPPSGRDTPDSAPPTHTQFSDLQDGDGPRDEDGARQYARLDRLGELKSESRNVDQGVNSSTSSLSRGAEVSRSNDFPFSIRSPPPNEEQDLVASNLKPNGTGDARLRGHSISSVSTDLSVDNPALSSSTTSASASVVVPTPALNNSPLPASEGSLTKRNNTPIDIDISTISSHAQAEALVQRTQKSILEMDDEIPMSSAALSSGRSPLSAKLAMYGETLELERRLKKEEQERKAAGTIKSLPKSLTTLTLQSPHSPGSKKSGLERQFSLEGHSPAQRRRKPRRPHTAGDAAPRPFDRVRDLRPTLDELGTRKSQDSPSTMAIVETSPTPDPSPPPSPLDYDAPYTAPVSTKPYADSSPDRYVHRRRSFQGPSLPRGVPTALDDADHAPPKLLQQRDRSQQIARANKLAKMGFSAAELPSPNSGSRPSNKLRFGGIKHLVDSIKGKR